MVQSNEIHPLTNKEISTFSSQMSMMISSGITIDEALRLIEHDSDTLEGKALIHDIYEYLENGKSLSYAMTESGYFPKYVLDMVHIGEETGKLDQVFESIAEYYEREEAVAEAIRQAVTYPFVMIIMMLCVIAVMITKVLPVFSDVYEELGASMTGVSAAIMNMGNNLSQYSIAILALIVLLIALYVFYAKTEKGHAAFEKIAISFPLTRELYDKISAGRFSSGMALAISAGFSAPQALALVEKLLTNRRYLKKVQLCKALMENGENFAEATVNSEIFEGAYGRMVSIGFKSGKLDSVMEKVSKRYEMEVDREMGHFISILEPTLVAILSVIVGMILLSVMLPLMGIMSQIG